MIKLYLDEDVPEAIAIALRLRGYNVLKQSHNGIILSRQLQVGVIIKALLTLLGNITPEKAKDQVIWLSDWISHI